MAKYGGEERLARKGEGQGSYKGLQLEEVWLEITLYWAVESGQLKTEAGAAEARSSRAVSARSRTWF